MKFLIIFLFLNFEFIQANLQNLTKRYSDNQHRVEQKNLNKIPNFLQNSILNLEHKNVSEICKKSQNFLKKSLKNLEFWSLQMLDANAKLPSGLLNGNVNQFGDFDQCINVEVPQNIFKGKFCLARVMLDIPDGNDYLSSLKHKILALNPFVSDFKDIDHIVPKSSEIKWAVCIPSTCDAKDGEMSLMESLNELFWEFSVNARVQVNEVECQVKQDEKVLSFGEKMAIAFFLILFTVIIISTVTDCYRTGLEISRNSILRAFSLKKNLTELLAVETAARDVKCMNCIRTVLTLILVTAHKSMELNFGPIANKKEMNEFLLLPLNLIFRMAYLHTDVFLMLSAYLVTQNFLKKVKKEPKIDILRNVADRYFRLVTPVAALVIFVTFVLPVLGNGPQWPALIIQNSRLCQKNWLRSAFMAQNLLGFEDICMMHTHHVATDFQLFLTVPFIAVFLVKYPQKTVFGLTAVAVISTAARFFVVIYRNLTVFVTAGTSIQDLVNAANYMYILPHYRVTVYSMGVVLAYYANEHKKETKINARTVTNGWVWAVLSLVTTFAISAANEPHTPVAAALFASICSVLYCGFFGWMIYISELGFANILSPILEWKYWKIGSNLSYAVYLVQFPVFHYNNAVMRGSSPYSFYGTILDLNEIFIVLFSATILTVCVDYPFRNLKKKLLDSKCVESKKKIF